MESPHLLLVSNVSDSGHVTFLVFFFFLYVYSHLGFVTAIFKPKFKVTYYFFSCFVVVTGVPYPLAITQSV